MSSLRSGDYAGNKTPVTDSRGRAIPASVLRQREAALMGAIKGIVKDLDEPPEIVTARQEAHLRAEAERSA